MTKILVENFDYHKWRMELDYLLRNLVLCCQDRDVKHLYFLVVLFGKIEPSGESFSGFYYIRGSIVTDATIYQAVNTVHKMCRRNEEKFVHQKHRELLQKFHELSVGLNLDVPPMLFDDVKLVRKENRELGRHFNWE